MDLIVTANGVARWGSIERRCAIGRGGLSMTKREGDGATPVGIWPCRRVLYRPDRLNPPAGGLAAHALTPDDGWCDAPDDPAYNQPVRLPHPASAETLWRDDRVYDLIVPLGYNDAPAAPGRGSAIFLHVARDDYTPTEGCVALALPDLLDFLAAGGNRVVIKG
jgi:L,D-peptidoglycan transpeptidase YkuD (ErfK/YbiS/YcfS/YnhG family)